jgi:hypothetical protein
MADFCRPSTACFSASAASRNRSVSCTVTGRRANMQTDRIAVRIAARSTNAIGGVWWCSTKSVKWFNSTAAVLAFRITSRRAGVDRGLGSLGALAASSASSAAT